MKKQFALKMTLLLASILGTLMTPEMISISAHAQSQLEIPAGTRFMVELRDRIDAATVKRGKKFEARTLEALESRDGRIIPAGAKIKGRVSYAEGNRLMLNFREIEARHASVPLMATVIRVHDERDIRVEREGEMETIAHPGRDAAIGAGIGAGLGAAAGSAKGGQAAAIGAGVGAGLGAFIGATNSGSELVLHDGTRLELQLDRALMLP